MTRTASAKGKSAAMHFATRQCSLGEILVAASRRGISAIFIGGDPDAPKLSRDLQRIFPHAALFSGDDDFARLVDKVIAFVEMPNLRLALPLDVRGTAFQQRVWKALQKIPVGETATYSEIAHRINAPKASRAVANACAANLLAVVIPCHRVVRADGRVSGYRWGIKCKRILLDREIRIAT